MPFRQPNGRGQFLNRGELTGIHVPSPTLSLIKFQGPRTKNHGPRSSNLGPETIRSWTEDLAPRTVVLGTRPSTVTAIMLYYNSHVGGRYAL